jgi:hypothetical protein
VIRRLLAGLLVIGLAGFGIAALSFSQTAQDVCAYIETQLNVTQSLKGVLCQNFQSGIARGHIQPARALQFLQAVDERITPQNQGSAETLLTLTGQLINPAKGDLPAEIIIRRTFEIFSKEQSPDEAMMTAVREATALFNMLQRVADVYRELGIALAPNEAEKTLQTEFGELELTVQRVDTVITATAVALDRFERRFDRRLDDYSGMRAEVVKELRAPSFYGAEKLPDELVRYIEAHTTGQEWAPIVQQLAADRGRRS